MSSEKMIAPVRAEYDQESFEKLRQQFDALQERLDACDEVIQKNAKLFEELAESGIALHESVFNGTGEIVWLNETNPIMDRGPKIVITRKLRY